MNARKIYDEADVLGGILDNKLFLGILGAEAALQVPNFITFANTHTFLAFLLKLMIAFLTSPQRAVCLKWEHRGGGVISRQFCWQCSDAGCAGSGHDVLVPT